MSKIKDLTGKRFGKLLVISLSHFKRKHRNAEWICVCDCGVKKIIRSTNLISGNSTSCGCATREINKKRHITHGKRQTSEYYVWVNMIQRCGNKNNRAYKNYGARGIFVCDRWLNSFENFFHDMGERPSLNHSIDRIDVDGNYEPNNCRWAIKKNCKTEIKGIITG